MPRFDLAGDLACPWVLAGFPGGGSRGTCRQPRQPRWSLTFRGAKGKWNVGARTRSTRVVGTLNCPTISSPSTRRIGALVRGPVMTTFLSPGTLTAPPMSPPEAGHEIQSHPKYKTRHHVGNWPEYDRSLVERGNLTIWISEEAIRSWTPPRTGRRGGQPKYPDLAIETALVLRLIFHLPLRQAEGFLRSVLELMDLDLEAPDHTTLSRRSRDVEVELLPEGSRRGRHLIVDSTGPSIVSEGEWATAKHGGKGVRGWRKLHLGVDEHGAIVAEELTESSADDAATVPLLLGQIDGRIKRFVADGAYDKRAV